MDIKISVIIPIYNMEKYLGECLDSVISQTLSEIEIICINDGSTDGSLRIANDYASKDNRIVIIDKKNEGVAAARNDGIKAAKGEFLAFMDPDDMYPERDVLEALHKLAIENDVKIAGGMVESLEPDGSRALSSFEKRCLENNVKFGRIDYSEYQTDYGFSAFIYNKKMIIENNIFFPLYKRFQDPPFFVRAMVQAKSFYKVQKTTYLYRAVYMLSKFSCEKIIDYLLGVRDNIAIAQKEGFDELQYLCATRLNNDGSYMVLNNIDNPQLSILITKLVEAYSCIDKDHLRKQGYDVPEVLDAIKYLGEVASENNQIRKGNLSHVLLGLAKKFKKNV